MEGCDLHLASSMNIIRNSLVFAGILILCIHSCFGKGQEVERPKFPPVFQVEVQGIFKDVKEEMEGTLFYDSVNNRGALRFTYQGETTQSIYRLDSNEFLYISGTECRVSEIRADAPGAFFPFYVDRSGNKTLAKPEEMFYFTNSTFDREEESFFPSYIYKAKLNFPPFDSSNCEVTHVFTKPEVKMPDCNSNICKPTLLAISITCTNTDGKKEVDQTYNLYRFKPYIIDTNVFLPPSGIFCETSSKKEFPGLPSYFSFSYDLIDEQEETGDNPGVFAVHKKVWYDSKMNIIRMDEFEDDGALIASRVFDIDGGVAYTSISSLSACEMGPISSEDVPLDEMTRLPKVFFRGEKALNGAVYVGTRHIHALDYEVWSLMSVDKETYQRIVQDFYFTKNIPKSGGSPILRLSHVEIYTYQRNEDTNRFELSVYTYLSINNFMDRLRWEAFDVSPCFTSSQKKKFRLKVDGPPTVKDSKTYLEILNRLYIQLIRATGISIIRLNELACVFDGVKIIEFTGWILEKPDVAGSEKGKKEPDMNKAYEIIVKLAKEGKLSLKLDKDGEVAEYKITAIVDIEPKDDKPTIPNVFQVEVQGIFTDRNSEMEGSLFYDKVNNRAAASFTYKGITTKKIYRFNDNEVLEITDTDCSIDKIDDNPIKSFFSFTLEKNGTKILAEPEKVFFFTNSVLDKSQAFVFPAYIYKGKIDIPQYMVTNCDIVHIFTRPEEKIADCESNSCQPTIATISVKCKKDDGSGIDHTYNFFRFRNSVSDTNVFLAPSGVHCKGGTNKRQFPGLPAYFSFSYDLMDEQDGSAEVTAVHKKVWYDSKLNIIRMDEYDDVGILIASRIFDFYGGVKYTSIALLSTCEIGAIDSKSISKAEMTRLPQVFFDGKEALIKGAVYVGTRHIHALDYEVWSFSSEDKLNAAEVVQDFYFTKNAATPEGSGKLTLSHLEIYKYQKNKDKSKLALYTYLSINSFIAKLRWEAFDISPCFTSEQKKGFRLKVEGPPTVKDSKTYQDVLKQLYLNLITATKVSVLRLSEVACVYDGVKIVEFTGWILDKPKVTGSETGKAEPDMHAAYKIIEDTAKAGKLSVKIKKDGKDVEYKITAIENIEHPDTIAKNRFSGGTLAGVSLGLFMVGFIIGVAGYYVFLRKRQSSTDYTMHLSAMKG